MSSRLHNVLVVGAGSIGERHIRCFAATGRTRLSFVELRDTVRDEVAGRHPDAKAFASLDTALERSFDAAVIATPAPLHIPQAMQLIERGVHVLIEKPLSVSLDGVDALLELAMKRRTVASVAYVYRAHPLLAAMREAIQRNEFGTPLELIAVAGQHFPFYRPAYAQTYYARHESGGGAVQDALTHLINAGEWLVGDIDRLVADVAHAALAGVSVEDTVHVLARQGRVLSSYSLNQHQAPNETTITVVCERGTVRVEFHRNRWRSMVAPGDPWTERGGDAIERDTLFIRQANAFLSAVEGKCPSACTLEEATQTLRVNLAILHSAGQGRWVSLRGDR